MRVARKIVTKIHQGCITTHISIIL